MLQVLFLGAGVTAVKKTKNEKQTPKQQQQQNQQTKVPSLFLEKKNNK